METKLEKIMRKDGWVLGRTENWGVEYWSFRKDGFEMPMKNINKVDRLDNISDGHFIKWRKEDAI